MWRLTGMAKLFRNTSPLGTLRAYRAPAQNKKLIRSSANAVPTLRERFDAESQRQHSGKVVEGIPKHQIGENVSRKDKISFLIRILMRPDDSKEAVYGALDAWVAWEQNFPLGPLRKALVDLEKEHQWHRIVQVIKWILSKGQGTTMGTYNQLIRALDMDRRAEEAHEVWVKKLGHDLHSVPWNLCHLMISVYYRNKMFERLVKLYKDLESFGRKPQEMMAVKKIAGAYEILGLVEEKERVLEKYKYLFETAERSHKKSRKSRKRGESDQSKCPSNLEDICDVVDVAETDS